MQRTLTNELSKIVGQEVVLKGWFHTIRKLGNIAFLIVRDRGGFAQVVLTKKEEIEKQKKQKFEGIIRPGKIELMYHHVFRVTKPAIVGVKVLRGRLKTDVSLLKDDGKNIGIVKTLKDKNDFLKEALQGKEIACAIDGPTVGRQIKEGDILYVNIPLPDYKKLKFEIYNDLTQDEKEILDEFILIKRKEDSLWGI